LIPIEQDRRLKDPEKIKADLATRTVKRLEEGATDPLVAQFVEGRLYVSDTSKTITIKHASEVFGDLPNCSAILLPDPSLFLRLGMLELVCSELPVAANAGQLASEEVRFGMTEGRCADPGRLLFGRATSMLTLARRLDMHERAGFKEGATLDARLMTQLDVLVKIGKGLWG
jgi:hypothetical protein